MASVAHEFHVTEAALAEANQLHESDSLTGHEAVVVPQAASVAPAAHAVLYTARKGDTLITIADRFGVSLAQLRSWNKVAGIKVVAGRKLHVTEPVSLPRSVGSRRSGSRASATETENAPEPSTTRKSTTRKSHRGASASESSADAKTTTRKSRKGESAKETKKESTKSREAAPSAKKSESGETKKSHVKNPSARSGSTRKKQK
jgi:membrane-bound lytic murein transglycosylase D